MSADRPHLQPDGQSDGQPDDKLGRQSDGQSGGRPAAQSGTMVTSVSIPVDEPERLAERARKAEAAGFDAIYITDHPAPSKRWLERGGHPTLDPFVALGFIAAATSTIRLHTNLLVLPYRHPLATAKAIASLDAVSAGRVLLGVGVGYLREEFDALGVDFDTRATAMDDALATMREAWLGEPMGEHGTVLAPRPIQRPHPPIWVGGNSRAAMRRAVEHGQGWSPMPSPKAASALLGTPGIESNAELADRINELHRLAEQRGRDEAIDVAVIPTSLSGFASSAPSVDELVNEIGHLASIGATALVLAVPDGRWDERIDELAESVLPKI